MRVCENEPWRMSSDQNAENLVELAKSFRLHPKKNGDTLKGIKQRIPVNSFTLQEWRGSGGRSTAFSGDCCRDAGKRWWRSKAITEEIQKKGFEIKNAKKENLVELADCLHLQVKKEKSVGYLTYFWLYT